MSEDSTQKLNTWLRGHRLQMLQCIPALVIFLLAVYRLSEIGQPILFNDEVGYWSNSAFFMGMDWTSVTGRIGYYSYGYSLLLVLIRMLASVFAWDWRTMYRAAVMMNAGFLVTSYVLALKLAGRYFQQWNDYIRTAACFAIFTYSTYIVYAHITWTESTLMFFFWVFLYIMMRVVDRPGIGNHIAFSLVSFYIYTVHQRALGIVASAVLMVVYLKITGRSRVRDLTAFLGSIYLYSLVHAMIKGNLQKVNYLGGAPAGWREIVKYALSKRSLILLVCGILAVLLLWLWEKGRKKTVLWIVFAGIASAVFFFFLRNNVQPAGAMDGVLSETGNGMTPGRLGTNDFSGQWSVVRDVFTPKGMIRLAISITGKWFYLASSTGLVVCWGIYGLFENAAVLIRDHFRQLFKGRCGVECTVSGEDTQGEEIQKNRIWLFGVLMAWFSTFMISAVYKEGFYKNDDLVNGRYTEFVLGFVLLYGLYRLINDKKWVRTAFCYMILYILAGALCQYAWNELQRTEFELAHCVMFGRVVWNYEVPVGKIAQLERYVVPLAVSFIVLLKLARERFTRVVTARTMLALLIPVLTWSFLGKRIVDVYVVVRNEKQDSPFIQIADWIRILGGGEPVYYIADSGNDRNPGSLQYLLMDRPVTVTDMDSVSFEEDAFYVMKEYLWMTEDAPVSEECEVVMQLRGYILAINKDYNLAGKWEQLTQKTE